MAKANHKPKANKHYRIREPALIYIYIKEIDRICQMCAITRSCEKTAFESGLLLLIDISLCPNWSISIVFGETRILTMCVI